MACPDFDELESLLTSAGDERRGSAPDVVEHVRLCAECGARLAELRENLDVAPSLRAALSEAGRPAAPLPERIGSFRILRELGRGGMGAVYEAEQDRPRRRVALKVVKSEFAAPQALRRFEHEAQVLALLQHPGIAQVYEAATAQTGREAQPYFAMELVEGRPLGAAAAERGLGTRQRLELLAEICDAVHHAHQKGVIHRDLKPSNILVDANGRAKILDFGVARLTDSDVWAGTLQTDVGQLIGTLPYMSPEQISGDPRQLDTRSDVYALGVIAFELLAGRLPYDLSNRMIPEAARVIREQEPTRLSSVDRVFRGDVETIVARALEKDRTQRYQSAAELAADIRRYLADEPITARPPSPLYQLRKFARRNRALVGSAAVAFAVLLAASVFSTWQAVRALGAEKLATARLDDARRSGELAERKEREARAAQRSAEESEGAARRAAEKALAVSRFLQDMLAAADPDRAPGRPDLTVREALARAVAELDRGSLAEQAPIEVLVRATIGNAFRSLADFDAAEPQLRRAVELGRATYATGHEDLAFALNKLARLMQERGRFDEAETLFVECLEMQRGLHGPEHEEVAKLLNNLGWLVHQKGDYAQAEQLHREALAMRRRLVGDEHTEVATCLNNLALALRSKGDLDGAAQMLRESLAMDRRLRGELHPNVAKTMANLAVVLRERQELEEAEALSRAALELTRRIHGAEHPDVARAMNNLALILIDRGNRDEAESLYRQAIDLHRRIYGERHHAVADALGNLAVALQDRGDLDGAEALLREAHEIRSTALGSAHPVTLLGMYHLAGNHTLRGRHDLAEPILAEVVAGARTALPPGHWHTASYLRLHGKCLTALGRFDEAEPELLESVRLFEGALGPDHARTRGAIEAVVELYDRWERPEQAAEWRARLAPEAGAAAPPR